MNYVGRIKVACLLVTLVVFVGCKSKQEQPKAGPEPVDQNAVSTAVPAQSAAATAPKDMADARAAAQHVLALMEAGDFATLYKESSAGFKQIGSESAFVTKFQQTRLKTGVLKNPKEVSFNTRPDAVHVLVYRTANEHYVTDIRLSFQRAKNGAMELAGLNQHDELKK